MNIDFFAYAFLAILASLAYFVLWYLALNGISHWESNTRPIRKVTIVILSIVVFAYPGVIFVLWTIK